MPQDVHWSSASHSLAIAAWVGGTPPLTRAKWEHGSFDSAAGTDANEMTLPASSILVVGVVVGVDDAMTLLGCALFVG